MTFNPRTMAAISALILCSASPIFAEGVSNGDGERTDEVQALSTVKLTAQDAGTAATAAVPGQIYDIGFDVAKAGPVWNVTVVDKSGAEMLVAVDATSGSILSKGPEGEHDDDQN